MKIAFLMDPLESLHLDTDTTFALMCSAQKRGHDILFCPQGGLILDQGSIRIHGEQVFPCRDSAEPFGLRQSVTVTQDDVDAVLIRTDPPFDEQYLFDTWMLELLPESIFVMNRPAGLRAVNEKLWAAQFTDLTPLTLISRRKKDLRAFLQEHKKIIVKPTNSFGGQGVFILDEGGININVIIETMTANGSREIIAQKYAQEAESGDKRILLLNGEPLGAVLRRHKKGEHRNNFYSGGQAVATEITDREREIIARLKPHLQSLGLYFVGIDVIGDYLIEVNVTSPTCLLEMNALYNQQLEEKVIDFVESQIIKKGELS